MLRPSAREVSPTTLAGSQLPSLFCALLEDKGVTELFAPQQVSPTSILGRGGIDGTKTDRKPVAAKDHAAGSERFPAKRPKKAAVDVVEEDEAQNDVKSEGQSDAEEVAD